MNRNTICKALPEKKKIISAICATFLFLTMPVSFYAQTFNGATGAISNNGVPTAFPASVSGLQQGQLDWNYGVVQVCIDISHPDVSELYVYLQSPSGMTVTLSQGSSVTGANFSNTCFNSSSNNVSVTLGTAPFSGTYRPVGYLGRFNNGQGGNGTWKLLVKDWLNDSFTGTVNSWSIAFGNSPPQPVSFTSSNLPIIFINASQAIGDNKILADMAIVDNGTNRNNVNDPRNGYNGKIDINLHGQSTKTFEKKSYHIETTDQNGNPVDGSLLGMPAEHQWDLIAQYQDKSLVRNALSYHLGYMMGHYSPRLRMVEIVLNGEYQGTYEFTEKVKRDSNRVHIKKLQPTENSWPDISGGYILYIDRNNSPGFTSLMAGNSNAGTHFYYQYEYPQSTDITPQQKSYIQSFVDSFETVMSTPAYPDPVTGYKKYIHEGSFVDYFIVNELSKNVDAYRFSTYLYKDHEVDGGKLHAGPLWDYNLAWHNCNQGSVPSTYGWQYQMKDDANPSPTWWIQFMNDSNFVNKVRCRWEELRQNVLSNATLTGYVDSMANVVNEAQQRNFIQWPVMGAYIIPNPQNEWNASFQSEVDDVKNWIVARANWLDGAIWGHCYHTTGAADMELQNALRVFPNPMESGTTFLFRLNREADVSLCVIDPLGKEVARFLNSQTPAGESKIDFSRKQLPAGVYYYQAQIETEIIRGKLIIQ